jgi:glycine/D-amino acid oxidase-like deaminating enzyme
MLFSDERTVNPSSIWLNGVQVNRYPTLTKNIRCEVCVIGGGISGLSAAYNLAKAKRHVVVIEKQCIGSGETGRTTAHLSNALHERYYKIEKVHGRKIAAQAAQIHSNAIIYIQHIIKNEGIKCNYERLPGYLFSEYASFNSLEREYDAASRADIPVETPKALSFNLYKGIKFNNQAQFHPIKYLYGLANSITKYFGEIFEQASVTSIHKQHSHIRIETNTGFVIDADSVVNATNKNLVTKLDAEEKKRTTRTYVIAAIMPKNILDKALYWDNNEPYHYIRLYEGSNLNSTLSEEEILLIGGEDHAIEETSMNTKCYEQLKYWAKKCFPQIKAFCHQWSGCVFDSYNYLHFIERNSLGRSQVYTIIGGNSNGLTHGTAAGIMVTDEIMQ